MFSLKLSNNNRYDIILMIILITHRPIYMSMLIYLNSVNISTLKCLILLIKTNYTIMQKGTL